MKTFLARFLIPLTVVFSLPSWSAEKIFRLHLSNEPGSLDPHKQRSSSASYLLGNLYRNLFYYDDNKGLVTDLAQRCDRDKKGNLKCFLKKDLKWSDGSPLTASDFVKSYQRLLEPKTGAPRADLLFHLKNAKEIYEGKKKPDTLGVIAKDAQTLQFEFSTPDPEFEYNLAGLILSPVKEDLKVFNGPYRLRTWNKGQKIILEPNPYYPQPNPQRPVVEFLFIEEDTVALQLYEKNELQFLRRLPTLFIPKYKSRKDFYWQPVLRFDYLGFGPDLSNNEDLRKALTYSLNYSELQRIFSSEGRPGCAGLPDSWYPEKAPCFDFNLKQVPRLSTPPTLTFLFSTLGGEDHKRATEWLQDQWQKNAGLKINLEGKENKVFIQTLNSKPPDIFRKGITPDHPTCLSALRTFSSGNPENYLRVQSPEYEKILSQLTQATKATDKKKLCLAGTEFLMKKHLMIPTGAIHFSILAKPDFEGWKLNQMNQLDLSNLRPRP